MWVPQMRILQARGTSGAMPAPSPDLVGSLILLTAAGWMFHLYRNQRAGRVLLFSSAYLLFPALSLLLKGEAFPPLGPLAKWGCVGVMGLLTAAMINATRKTEGSVLRGLVAAEAERSKVVQEEREEEERKQRIILRAKAYALAEVASAHLPPISVSHGAPARASSG